MNGHGHFCMWTLLGCSNKLMEVGMLANKTRINSMEGYEFTVNIPIKNLFFRLVRVKQCHLTSHRELLAPFSKKVLLRVFKNINKFTIPAVNTVSGTFGVKSDEPKQTQRELKKCDYYRLFEI